MSKERDKQLVLKYYRSMLTIRCFEERIKELYRAGEFVGAIHLYIGQEAIAVGLCSQLSDKDYVFSTHRGHGHYLAKTHDTKGALAELYGKETGCSRGYGGSMHMFNLRKGFMGGNGIVGGGIPLALGAAFTAQYKKTDQVSVAFFGEGASNQGTFHESLNLAALKRLPLIAVCENNRYAATTPVALSTSDEDMTKRASAYGIKSLRIDGNDLTEVIAAAKTAVKYVRSGKGPFLLDCKTYRVEPHCGIIADKRPEDELAQWQKPENDPLNCYQSQYPEELNPAAISDLEKEVKKEIDVAVEFARQSSFPKVENFIKEFAVQ
jgi:acetoin:2,6-dichlorophenolindophenol oxidoreductase subunit alpha